MEIKANLSQSLVEVEAELGNNKLSQFISYSFSTTSLPSTFLVSSWEQLGLSLSWSASVDDMSEFLMSTMLLRKAIEMIAMDMMMMIGLLTWFVESA